MIIKCDGQDQIIGLDKSRPKNSKEEKIIKNHGKTKNRIFFESQKSKRAFLLVNMGQKVIR